MVTLMHYKDIGLVNTREMFKKAMEGGYAVPAYNFNNNEQLQAIVIGCVESKSPVILQVSGSARKYADQTLLPHMVKGAVAMARKMGSPIPMALHLDHGDSFELAKDCIDSDGRLAMTAVIRRIFTENPAEFDPRKYLGPARDELVKVVKHKNTKVLGSAGRA